MPIHIRLNFRTPHHQIKASLFTFHTETFLAIFKRCGKVTRELSTCLKNTTSTSTLHITAAAAVATNFAEKALA